MRQLETVALIGAMHAYIAVMNLVTIAQVLTHHED